MIFERKMGFIEHKIHLATVAFLLYAGWTLLPGAVAGSSSGLSEFDKLGLPPVPKAPRTGLAGKWEGVATYPTVNDSYGLVMQFGVIGARVTGTTNISNERDDDSGVLGGKGTFRDGQLTYEEQEIIKIGQRRSWLLWKMNLKLNGDRLEGKWQHCDDISGCDGGNVTLKRSD